ncbi:MAG: PASTA domain-containing protein, partial [Actinobacteria bacterium]|nr:PASTA domain-containing protein [Actinomycetota bacterium]
GLYCSPRAVVEILDADRKPISLPRDECEQVLEPSVADTVTSVLRGVIDGPEAYRTGIRASIGRPAAGKTGTVQESWFAWFIGYTPQLATSVWMGVPGELTPMKRVTINGQYYKQVYGGDIPASIWRQEMSAAHEGLPVQDFTQADATVVAGEQVPVPDVRGLDYDSAREILSGAGFGVRRGGYVSADYVSRGEVAYTYPARESLAPAGSTVSVYIASGRRARTVQPSPARLFVPTSPEPAVPQPSPSPKKKGRR